MAKNSIRKQLITILSSCTVGEELIKRDLIKKVGYNPEDYYSRRSFDTSLCNAKKFIPNLKFKSNSKGLIIRIR